MIAMRHPEINRLLLQSLQPRLLGLEDGQEAQKLRRLLAPQLLHLRTEPARASTAPFTESPFDVDAPIDEAGQGHASWAEGGLLKAPHDGAPEFGSRSTLPSVSAMVGLRMRTARRRDREARASETPRRAPLPNPGGEV